MTHIELAERVKSERIKVGSRSYRRFIPYPEEVTDDTPRCIQCGQIDEEPYHDMSLCFEIRETICAALRKGTSHG